MGLSSPSSTRDQVHRGDTVDGPRAPLSWERELEFVALTLTHCSLIRDQTNTILNTPSWPLGSAHGGLTVMATVPEQEYLDKEGYFPLDFQHLLGVEFAALFQELCASLHEAGDAPLFPPVPGSGLVRSEEPLCAAQRGEAGDHALSWLLCDQN